MVWIKPRVTTTCCGRDCLLHHPYGRFLFPHLHTHTTHAHALPTATAPPRLPTTTTTHHAPAWIFPLAGYHRCDVGSYEHHHLRLDVVRTTRRGMRRRHAYAASTTQRTQVDKLCLFRYGRGRCRCPATPVLRHPTPQPSAWFPEHRASTFSAFLRRRWVVDVRLDVVGTTFTDADTSGGLLVWRFIYTRAVPLTTVRLPLTALRVLPVFADILRGYTKTTRGRSPTLTPYTGCYRTVPRLPVTTGLL